MKCFKIILGLIFILNMSCSNDNEIIINIEEPTNKELNNLAIELMLDGKSVYNYKLVQSNVVPRYETISASMNEKSESILGVKIKDSIFNFTIKYPENKYIIVAPYIKEGKIYVGYKSQEKKFYFH